jgi:hypothetical protein
MDKKREICVGDTVILSIDNIFKNEYFSGIILKILSIDNITNDECQRYVEEDLSTFREDFPNNKFIYIVRGHRAHLSVNLMKRDEWIASFGEEYRGLAIYKFKKLYKKNNPYNAIPTIPKECYEMVFTDNIIRHLIDDDFSINGEYTSYKTHARP